MGFTGSMKLLKLHADICVHVVQVYLSAEKAHTFYQIQGIDPTHDVSCGSLNPSFGYFLSSGMHNWNVCSKELVESPHWFPDWWSEGCYGEKGQVEATRTAYRQF